MNKKFFIGLILFVLTFILIGTVCAEDSYTITVTTADTITDEAPTSYLNLDVPQISGMADEETQEMLNAGFANFVNELAEEYEADKAYFQESFAEDEMPHFGLEFHWETVIDNLDTYVFKTILYYAAGSSMTVNEYYTLDKQSGKLIELSEVADEAELAEIHDMIMAAMEYENENGGAFWTEDEAEFDYTFALISDARHWYINDTGNLVITFDKYEIAPGAYGSSEFEINGDKATLLQDNRYIFDLYVGDVIEDETDNWFLKLQLPVIGGMADQDQQDQMNEHFTEMVNGIKEEFDISVSTAEKSIEEGNEPHFGYAYYYTILTDTADIFAFSTSAVFYGGSTMISNEFWNLDKVTGELIRWEAIVPTEAEPLIRDQIFEEMKAANESGEGSYWVDDDARELFNNSFGEVSNFHHWYLNADGKLVIVFDKYEIAPGVMGTPTFTIDLTELVPAE